FEVPAIVPADPEANTSDLLAIRAQQTPQLALFSVPEGDGWRDITARDFETAVIALAKGFAAAGIQPGEEVGFVARTTYEWTLIGCARFDAGAVMVPIYETRSPAQIQWIMEDSGAPALIVESPEQFARVDEVRGDLPRVREVWQLHLGAIDTLT